MEKPNIAIFGATSHIAKGLINNFFQNNDFSLSLFTRSPEKVRAFLKKINHSSNKNYSILKNYQDLKKHSYQAIINCVGVGTAKKIKGDYTLYFSVTEKFDNPCLDYLQKISPQTLYFSFSSGAVYGSDYSAPMQAKTSNQIRVNQLKKEDYYGLVRLYTEAKHRAFKSLNIVDLRLFSYFSRFIDLKDGYFITELLKAILNKKVFLTTKENIIRDYLHPQDLFSFIQICLQKNKINDAFDLSSLKPVNKQEILDYFSKAYGLKYKFSQSIKQRSATGSKNIYYSKYNKASHLGYKPASSSLKTIEEESRYILDTSTRNS